MKNPKTEMLELTVKTAKELLDYDNAIKTVERQHPSLYSTIKSFAEVRAALTNEFTELDIEVIAMTICILMININEDNKYSLEPSVN